MFERLLEVNWAKLKVVPGSNPTAIPRAIQHLLSDLPQERREAYWQLDNVVVVQSDLFEAAWYVVPFLLELLSTDTILGRTEVYDLLYEIGNGSAHPDETVESNPNVRVPLQQACRQAVLNGIGLYLSEIGDPKSMVRQKALELILSLDELFPISLDTIQIIAARETNADFRDQLQKAITIMGAKDA